MRIKAVYDIIPTGTAHKLCQHPTKSDLRLAAVQLKMPQPVTVNALKISLGNNPTFHPRLESFVQELNAQLNGEYDFSAAGVALYTSDASNYRQIPLGVVYPKTSDDVVYVTRLCREHGLPVLMRGGGTSQNGQCVNEAVVLDCSRFMTSVIDIDVENRTALIEPGIICDSLKAEAEQHGLTFGPDPATHSRCTLGGMIGNNSCGPRSMLAGKTVENVLELEVLTSDGARFWVGPTTDEELTEILKAGDRKASLYSELVSIRDDYAALIREKYPTIKRRVSGYNLDQLLPENGFNVARALVGSEGTCVSILQARVRLITNPEHKKLIVLGYDNIFLAGDSVASILPFSPIAMEGLDWNIVGGLIERKLRQREVALLPEGRAWVLIELADQSTSTLQTRCDKFINAMQASPLVKSVMPVDDVQTAVDLWSIREQGASATSLSIDPDQNDPIVGWEDTAVDPLRLGDYLRAFQQLIDQYGYSTSLYGHFGDGCIHARITFDTRSEEGVAKWRQFSNDIARLIVSFGGSLSGEHGDGQAKAEFLPILFGDELMHAFKRFKLAWDPDRRMNPGKLIDAYRMDENLRFGPDYTTPVVETALHFSEDPRGFGRSSERCIGMGKCRAHSGAMCPSYQATGEERYSTRGRAHMLHELVRGDILVDGWQSIAIADSMEHCLSCKACKSECPTQVDIAAYKAEFMHKHYESARHPLHHYVFGHIGSLLPRLSKISSLLNLLQRTGPGKLFAKKVLGISAEKSLPALATHSFMAWISKNHDSLDTHFYWVGNSTKPPIVLWSDSINAHYKPEILISAITVLCKIGYRVAIARQNFCCGRPFYDYGFLAQARQKLSHILDSFYKHLPADSTVVVLEPSCLSVFRDELLRQFPDDERAIALAKRSATISDVLTKDKIPLQQSFDTGLLHLHCHGKSLHFEQNDRSLMEKCIKQVREVEYGCCGMAGVYGMRSKTRAIATTLFRRQLQPAINASASNTIVISDGFSCSSQIFDHTARKVMHPIQIIESCLT